jgi:hypothetical protein
MRVTLNDGRQMTGQLLAFDKVCGCHAIYVSFRRSANTDTAHEPGSRRYRGIPTDQEEASPVFRPWRIVFNHPDHRAGREAHPRLDHRPGRPDRIPIRRISSTSRPEHATGKVYSRWRRDDSRSRPRCRKSCRAWRCCAHLARWSRCWCWRCRAPSCFPRLSRRSSSPRLSWPRCSSTRLSRRIPSCRVPWCAWLPACWFSSWRCSSWIQPASQVDMEGMEGASGTLDLEDICQEQRNRHSRRPGNQTLCIAL